MNNDDAVATIDRLIGVVKGLEAELLNLRASFPAVAEPEPEEEVDDILIETTLAAERFNMPADTIRKLCRDKGYGKMRGGRWMVSVRMLNEHKRL